MTKEKRIKIRTVVVLLTVFVFLFGLFYFTTYYEASDAAIQLYNHPPEGFASAEGDHWFVLAPQEFFEHSQAKRAILFYPGAKVDSLAYFPTLFPLVQDGIPVIILDFPFHFAIFASQSGEEVLEQFPGIETWTLAGHSLGSVVAGWQALRSVQQSAYPVDSVVYLAGYGEKSHDLSGSGLHVLVVSADNDGLITPEELDEGRQYLPADTRYRSIIGANHAQFGSYGLQQGDASAAISREAQQEQTAFLMRNFIRDIEAY